MRYFDYYHLPEGPARDRAQDCHSLAYALLRSLPDSAELTVGLRKLLEAKDCSVGAGIGFF